jgi:hypothetical protein
MNAFTSMARTLANIGRQKPHQDVRVVWTLTDARFGPQRLVAVGNRYYRVNDQTYQKLLAGHTPEDMELDEAEPEEIEPDDYQDRAASEADRAFQLKQEQF